MDYNVIEFRRPESGPATLPAPRYRLSWEVREYRRIRKVARDQIAADQNRRIVYADMIDRFLRRQWYRLPDCILTLFWADMRRRRSPAYWP